MSNLYLTFNMLPKNAQGNSEHFSIGYLTKAPVNQKLNILEILLKAKCNHR